MIGDVYMTTSQNAPSQMPALLKMSLIYGIVEAVEQFLEKGMDVNICDEKGRTPIFFASSNGHQDLCFYLLKKGADPNKTDINGKSAISIAIQKEFQEIVSLLQLYSSNQHFANSEKLSNVNSNEEKSSVQDSSFWEEEEVTVTPENDQHCFAVVQSLQKNISIHSAVDTDVDWSDVLIELPEIMTSSRNILMDSEDVWLPEVKRLVRAGLYDFKVSFKQVEKIIPRDEFGEEIDPQFKQKLYAFLEDLGINVEENFNPEFSDQNNEEYYEIDLAETFEYFRNIVLLKWDAQTDYLKNLGTVEVLTPQEEHKLCRIIESGAKTVIDSLIRNESAANALSITLVKLINGDIPHAEILKELEDSADSNHIEDLFEDQAETDEEIATDISFSIPFEMHNRITKIIDTINLRGEDRKELVDDIYRLNLKDSYLTSLRRYIEQDTLALDMFNVGSEEIKKARMKLVLANLKLVPWIASKYRYSNFDLIDLLQEGTIGLMKASERFDHRRGAKFSTYAIWWIRQTISRAIIAGSRMIRIPVHIYDHWGKVKRLIELSDIATGQIPSTEKIAIELSISPKKVDKILKIPEEPIKFDDMVEEGYGCLFQLPDLDSDGPEERAIKIDMRNTVRKFLDNIPPREAEIIRMRFGLEGFDEHTLEAIGEKYALTRERIRQLESKAFVRLQHPSRAKILKQYLNYYDYNYL